MREVSVTLWTLRRPCLGHCRETTAPERLQPDPARELDPSPSQGALQNGSEKGALGWRRGGSCGRRGDPQGQNWEQRTERQVLGTSLGGRACVIKLCMGVGEGRGRRRGASPPDSTQSAAPGEGRHRQSRVPTAGLSMETGGEKGR